MSARRAARRRESRRLALQALYAADLAPGESIEAAFDAVAANFDLHPGALAFAKELACGTLAAREAIDARIAAHAQNWRIERMAAVDRNLLRLAVHELSSTDTPAEVVINEAVELARDFGGERSPAFVNGVLDAVARSASKPSEDRTVEARRPTPSADAQPQGREAAAQRGEAERSVDPRAGMAGGRRRAPAKDG